jgi:hypothetical protein
MHKQKLFLCNSCHICSADFRGNIRLFSHIRPQLINQRWKNVSLSFAMDKQCPIIPVLCEITWVSEFSSRPFLIRSRLIFLILLGMLSYFCYLFLCSLSYLHLSLCPLSYLHLSLCPLSNLHLSLCPLSYLHLSLCPLSYLH